MVGPGSNQLMHNLRRLVRATGECGESDESLLEAFIAGGDEAAFEAIVRRHGGMVMGVCRRVLCHHADAEDAFQATFFVLARRARSITSRSSLSQWLHGVAVHAALKGKQAAAARKRHEQERAKMSRTSQPQPPADNELSAILDEEIRRLPKPSQSVIVICDLEGRTRKDAAAHLGWPEGTVAGRLARARALLAKRLIRRGVSVSAAAWAGSESIGVASAAVATEFVKSTSRAAIQFGGSKFAVSAISSRAVDLATAVLRSCSLAKVKSILLSSLALAILAVGAGMVMSRWTDAAPPDEKVLAAVDGPKEAEVEARVDALGDPLPPHALARLGTMRLRHGDNVRLLNYSPDGKTLLSADWHGVHIWDAATGKHLRKFGELKDDWQFQHCAVSGDHRIVALSVNRGVIEIWDMEKDRVVREIKTGRFPVLAVSHDGSVLAVRDSGEAKQGEPQSLRLFDTSSGAQRHRLTGHDDRILEFHFTKDGKTFVTLSEDKSVCFWDTATGQQVRKLDLPVPVTSFLLSPDQKLLATVESKKFETKGENYTATGWINKDRVEVRDVGTGKVLFETAAHKYTTFPVAFSPDSKILYSSDGTSLRCWIVATRQEAPEMNLPAVWAHHLTFSPDGKSLATGGGSTIQLWDLATRRQKLAYGQQNPVQRTAFSPDGTIVAVGGQRDPIHLWDAASGKEVRKIPGFNDGNRPLGFGANGKTLLATSISSVSQSATALWEISTGKELRRYNGSIEALSPDEKWLVVRTQDGNFEVSDFAAGKLRCQWSPTAYTHVVFFPDSRFLYEYTDATAKRDSGKDEIAGEVVVRDAATAMIVRRFDIHPVERDPRIYGVAFSPDGRWAAFCGHSSSVVVYDMATGNRVKALSTTPKHAMSHTMFSLAFSPDSRLLAGGDWSDGRVHIWEMATGQEFQSFPGHKGRVMSLTFSPDGAKLISGGEDTTGLVWDVTGQRAKQNRDPLSEDQLKKRWIDLRSPDSETAQRAVGALAASPKQSLPMIEKEIRPVPTVDAERMRQLLSKLDADGFQERSAATSELEKLGSAAEPALRRALANSPPLEMKRRIETILEKLEQSPDRLRLLRVLQCLEQIRDQDADRLMRSLANGADGAWLTEQARQAVERLARRLPSNDRRP